MRHHSRPTLAAAVNIRQAPKGGTVLIALRNQSSSGATRTLPPFGAILCEINLPMA